MNGTIKVTNESRAHCVVVRAEGALTARNILDVRNAFEEALAKSGNIAVELSGIHNMDSMGVGILVNLHRRIKGKSGMLAILNPSEVARDILEIADLDKLLRIHSGFDDLDSLFA